MAKKLQKISRQRIWQEARRLKHLCVQCGDEPLLTKNLGARCARKQRERMRKKTDAKVRYRNSKSYKKPKG